MKTSFAARLLCLPLFAGLAFSPQPCLAQCGFGSTAAVTQRIAGLDQYTNHTDLTEIPINSVVRVLSSNGSPGAPCYTLLVLNLAGSDDLFLADGSPSGFKLQQTASGYSCIPKPPGPSGKTVDNVCLNESYYGNFLSCEQ